MNGYSPAYNELRDKFILGLRDKHFLDIQKRIDDLPNTLTACTYHEPHVTAQTYLDNAKILEGSNPTSTNDNYQSSRTSRQSISGKDQRRQRAIHAAIMDGTS